MYCNRCGKENRDEANFCFACGQPLRQSQNPGYAGPGYCNPPYQGYQNGSPAQFVEFKESVVALLLALILPGAGHMYAGEMKKGIFFLAFFIIVGIAITVAFFVRLMSFTTSGDISSSLGLIIVTVIITAIVWLYQVYDAYQAAVRFNVAHVAQRRYS